MLSLLIILLLLTVLLPNMNVATNSILNKQMRSANVGKELGLNFEGEVRNILVGAGYRNLFYSKNNMNGVFVNMGKTSSEFDAIVTGSKNSFGNFCDCFVSKYICSAPLGDSHIAIVEAKLNARLLNDWVKGKEGSKHLFFNKNSTEEFTKILVLNGGSDSEAFINSLSSVEEIGEFAEVKKAIKEAKINVFYKLWASGESFADIIKFYHNLQNENEDIKKQNEGIKNENEDIKKQNEDIRNENEDIRNENQEIKNLCHDLQNEIAWIKGKLNL